MNRRIYFTTMLVAALVGFAFAGCSIPPGSTEQEKNHTAAVQAADGKTVLAINLGSSSGGAKTVLPATPTIGSYTLSADNGSGFQVVSTFASLPATATINQGTYNFKLEGLDSGGNKVLAQVQLGVAVGTSSLSLDFVLAPISAGNGSVSVSVSWPNSVSVASADAMFGLIGGAQSITAASISAGSVTFGQSAVPNGSYLLTIRLKDGTGNVLASVMEAVRVYQYLVSSKSISLAAGDFNGPPTAPSSAAAAAGNAQVTVSWVDASNNETGFMVERSSDGGASWTVLTTNPLLGGTATYTDTATTARSRYSYRVYAINAFGASAYAVSPSVTMVSAGRYLYVTNCAGDGTHHGTASAYAIGSNGLLTPLSTPTFATGEAPTAITVTPNGSFLYVSNHFDNSTVSAYSISSGGLPIPLSTPAFATETYPSEMAVTPDGSFLYLINGGSDTVSAYAVGPGGLLTPLSTPTFATGDGPWGIVMTPNGSFLYVTNYFSNTVSAFTIDSDGLLTPVSTPAFATGTSPTEITVTPNGCFLYITNYNSNTISAYAIGSGGLLTP